MCSWFIFEFKRSAWFHARAFAFCLMVPHDEKVTKKKAENNLFQFCFTLLYVNVLFFVICRHFTTWKLLEVLKLSKRCLKMVKAMTPKTTSQNILFLNERIPFNLHGRFNECGIKLLILINNYLWINLESTRNLRPWYMYVRIRIRIVYWWNAETTITHQDLWLRN